MSLDSGMDVERVRSIAQQLLAQGAKIGDVASTGRGQLGVLDGAWKGSDVEDFSGRWGGAEKAAHEASQGLRSYAELLIRQADDQQQASDGVGGASGTGTGTGAPQEGGGLWDTITDAKFWGGMGAKAWTLLTKPGVVLAALKHGSLLRALNTANTLEDWMKASWAFNRNAYSFLKGVIPGSSIMQRLGVPAQYLDDIARSSRLGAAMSKLPWAKGASLAGNALSKVLGPVGIVTGGLDIWNGIKDGDYLKAFGGAAGLTSGALTTAVAFGAIAGGPVTLGIAAGAAVISAGIAIYQNWDAISQGVSDAWNATTDFVSDKWNDFTSGVSDFADSVGSVLSDPVGAFTGLFD